MDKRTYIYGSLGILVIAVLIITGWRMSRINQSVYDVGNSYIADTSTTDDGYEKLVCVNGYVELRFMRIKCDVLDDFDNWRLDDYGNGIIYGKDMWAYAIQSQYDSLSYLKSSYIQHATGDVVNGGVEFLQWLNVGGNKFAIFNVYAVMDSDGNRPIYLPITQAEMYRNGMTYTILTRQSWNYDTNTNEPPIDLFETLASGIEVK